MELDVDRTTHALGIAGSSSGGLLEFLTTGASTKQLHPGSAAMNGIIAARLAAAGATGPATVLEGPHGLYAALAARDADVESVVASLGSRWETTRITIKPYPACQLMHVTLDAVRQIQPAPAEDIVSVVAQVHPDSAAVVCEPAVRKIRPRTAYDAKFSLPWSVAALLTDGEIGVATYDADSIDRPEVAELAARVRTEVTSDTGVAADASGRVDVTLRDGSVRRGEAARSTGGPDAPLSAADLSAKFTMNAGSATADLSAAVLALGTDPAVTARSLAAATTSTSRSTP